MTEQTPLPTRVSNACDRCRRNKSRCDSSRPCLLCSRAGTECITTKRNAAAPRNATEVPGSSGYQREITSSRRKRIRSSSREESTTPHDSSAPQARSSRVLSRSGTGPRAIGETAQSSGRGHPHNLNHESAGDNLTRAASMAAPPARPDKTSTSAYLLHSLPSEAVMVVFLKEYFASVHWFSLVIYEPTFRPVFDEVRAGTASSSQRPFLLLLSTVLGLGAWYHAQRPYSGHDVSPQEAMTWSENLIANAESRLVELLDQSSMTAVQTLTLLGSFFVYHGRPNLSFSLLGATVKSAHAAGLHKRLAGASKHELEERKRVWWTIYTWDRFASITYGRPVSIDEQDCNVPMPDDVFENVDFLERGGTHSSPICFSAYQRELNKLYMIASPAIKRVYNAREAVDHERAREYLTLLGDVTQRLWEWKQILPDNLSLDLSHDCPGDLNFGSKAHYLQSLSLHLTFDSLLIVLHRPFLKRQMSALQRRGIAGENEFGVSGLNAAHTPANPTVPSSRCSSEDLTQISGDTSEQQWWNAAVRTSKVTELPQLAQFASDGHLIAFLAINLFNAALVMVVLSLSDPLMDRTQEAKRAIARIHRLQATLGPRSCLSKQSTKVLQNLVLLLMQRESDEILAPLTSRRSSVHQASGPSASSSDLRPLSVRDTLSIALGPHSTSGADQVPQAWEDDSLRTASRLGDSLASVQRAITVQPRFGYNNAQTSISSGSNDFTTTHPHHLDVTGTSGWDFSDMTGYETGDTGAGSEWSIGPLDARNGVYWFWDPGWDQVYDEFADWN